MGVTQAERRYEVFFFLGVHGVARTTDRNYMWKENVDIYRRKGARFRDAGGNVARYCHRGFEDRTTERRLAENVWTTEVPTWYGKTVRQTNLH